MAMVLDGLGNNKKSGELIPDFFLVSSAIPVIVPVISPLMVIVGNFYPTSMMFSAIGSGSNNLTALIRMPAIYDATVSE